MLGAWQGGAQQSLSPLQRTFGLVLTPEFNAVSLDRNGSGCFTKLDQTHAVCQGLYLLSHLAGP